MAKLEVTIYVPDDNCEKCPYFGRTYREIGYCCGVDEYYCKLFGNAKLTQKDGVFERCGACICCENKK